MIRSKPRGSALLASLLALLLLTLLGSLSLKMARLELRMGAYQHQDSRALYLAESGLSLVSYWFQHPGTAPQSFQTHQDAPFTGGRTEPDVVLEAPGGLDQIPPAWRAVWEALSRPGDTLSVRVYAPQFPGAVATVESTARTALGVRKTLGGQWARSDAVSTLRPLPGSWHEIY